MGRLALVVALLLSGCNRSNGIVLRYHLRGLTPGDVVRVETLINVDAAVDKRMFYADSPYREVATGLGYEVRDLDGSGTRTMLVTFDSTLGYQFKPQFTFTLLPPADGASPPKLTLQSRAMGVSDAISGTSNVTGSFGGGAVDIDLSDSRCTGGLSCPADQMCCPGAGCVRTTEDVAHCGGCDHACGTSGDSCTGGACRCAGGSGCVKGQTCCAGLGCVDLMIDPFHCGTCDHACNPGERCVAGSCSCGSGPACTGAMALCCANGNTMSCSTGTCPCGTGSCAWPGVCCNATCVDPASNDSNCGSCGHACTSPLACNGGACQCNGVICSAGDVCCASGCANLDNDPANCGACGTRCSANQTCGRDATGTISCLCNGVTCAVGESCCGTSCVDTNTSFNNCGACGHSCKQGEQCLGGACSCNGAGGCVGNQVCCGPQTAGGGGCFDVAAGPQHCGSCAAGACPPGETCQLGSCVATSNGCNPQCGNGNQCVSGRCICMGNGNSAQPCTGNLSCCSGVGCVDLTSDPNHCNDCNKSCGADPLCCDGECKPYSPTDCGKCATDCKTAACCKPCILGGSFQCADVCRVCI
jgi:hypothetical protein